MTAAWTADRRADYARKLRTVNPRRLTDWEGLSVRGEARMNPYQDYVRSYFRGADRAEQIANLLVGDLVVEVLFDDDIRITDLATATVWWPHRAPKRARELEAST